MSTTNGEWGILILSFICTIVTTIHFVLLTGKFGIKGIIAFMAIYLIPLYILYWIITKVYPKSEGWGIITWVAVFGIPLIFFYLYLIGSSFQ